MPKKSLPYFPSPATAVDLFIGITAEIALRVQALQAASSVAILAPGVTLNTIYCTLYRTH